MLPALSHPVHAAPSESYVFQGADYNSVTLKAKGGPFGDSAVEFSQDADLTSKFGDPASHTFVYSATYNCQDSSYNASIKSTLPSDLSNGDASGKFFLTEITKGGKTISPDGGSGFISNAQMKQANIPESCVPASFKITKITNFNTLSSAEQQNWSGTDPPDSNSDTCGGSFGWLICPMIKGVEGVVSWIETNIIQPFLHTPPLSFDATCAQNNDTGCLYSVWNIIRTIANISFILIFLVIIFANTLGWNLNAYAVRKILPKLIAAGLLVQFSFMICAIAIDIANVIGGGIFTLIDGLLPGYAGSIGGGAAAGSGFLGLSALMVGAVTAIGIANSAAALTVLLGAFLGVLLTFLTLVLRQIVITLLVILSPLAFAAWVLPGTEKYFEEWWEVFTKLLLMYPLIMLIFAAGKLFAVAAGATAATHGMGPLFALIGVTAPLFLIPIAFGIAGSIFGRTRELLAKGTARAGGAAHDRLSESDMAKSWETKRSNATTNRMSKLNDKLKNWSDNSSTKLGKRSRGAAGKALMFGAAGLTTGNLALAGNYGLQKEIQDQVKNDAERIKTLNVSRPDLQKLAAGEDVPGYLRPLNRTSGRAAALRQLNEDEAKDESAKVQDALRRMQDQRTAAEIRRLGYQGKGGLMYVAEPALSGGGLSGTDLLKYNTGEKIRANYLAKMMSDPDTVSRNFGSNIGTGFMTDTRALGSEINDDEMDLADKWLRDNHGLAGGLGLSMTVAALRGAMSPRQISETNSLGRRRMKEALTGPQAMQKIALLQGLETGLRNAGRVDEADRVLKQHQNLQALANEAQNIPD
jgi:hypothetical protein